ncbi:MAG: transcription antitermination factor NusB [Planctomycetaceae bacterium]
MPRRSDARKCVLQMLYLIDQNPDADIHRIRTSMESELKDDTLIDFAWAMFTGVRELRNEIDKRITAVATNWRIDRMAPTDRNVLRMGLFEIEFIQTPVPVVLNECIELAREFGAENSPSFVNGILDKLCGEQPADAP